MKCDFCDRPFDLPDNFWPGMTYTHVCPYCRTETKVPWDMAAVKVNQKIKDDSRDQRKPANPCYPFWS